MMVNASLGALSSCTQAHQAPQPLTLGVQRIEPINLTDPSILAGLEQARRALSNQRLVQVLGVRTAIQQYLCNRLAADGYLHPPVYMLAGCTDPLNHWTYPARINYYGEEVSVTQSLILQKVLMVMGSPVGKVFWASPNIRMEMRINRKEYKYTTEFMQVDFEQRDATYEQMLDYVSSLLEGLFRHLNQHHAETLRAIRGELLPELEVPLPVHDVRQVQEEQQLSDDDAVERWLARRAEGRPFLLVNLEREAYDCYDQRSGRFLNYDVIVPPYGDNPHPVECLSGAERTRTVGDLAERMLQLGYPMDYFQPFFELLSSLDGGSGRIRCAGGGFGIERLTYGLLGLRDIHEVYPFPRMAESKVAF
jgi:asparaginyl-tRNA synthetase